MYGLSEDTVKDICSVFRKHHNVVKVIIFGSRAKGNYREGSDIDLAVVGVGLSFSLLMDLNVQIENLGLLYKVDIVDYAKLVGTPIREHIDRVGKLFYQKEMSEQA